ncbi:MAG: nucleoside hydrolase [Clostridia bacterium]|nr:nucleoside hydrolase [Clostridia bacterium]
MADGRTPLLIDCDPGIDDAVALVFALCHPAAEVVAIGSVHGNVPASLAAENALRVLEILGDDRTPVAEGAARPIAQELSTDEWVHGQDGLGDTRLPAPRRGTTGEHAADQIVRLCRERPGELTLVALGPLTNVALALLKEPELPRLVRRVVVMGGAAAVPGNATAVAEANIWHDPEAADLVFRAGWPLAMVGLDVTMKALFGLEERDRLRRLAESRPAAAFLDAILAYYTRVYEPILGRPAAAMHDPLAVAAALEPDLVRWESWPVRVERRGEWTRGMTVADRRMPARARAGRPASDDQEARVEVAVEVDATRFLDRLLAVLARAPEGPARGTGG